MFKLHKHENEIAKPLKIIMSGSVATLNKVLYVNMSLNVIEISPVQISQGNTMRYQHSTEDKLQLARCNQ